MGAETPSRDDDATTACPVCERLFTPSGRASYCSDACRKQAWRRRHQPPAVPIVVPAPGRPRRPITVYECPTCSARALGSQRYDDCGTFMARVGVGGLCPHCDLAVAVSDLLGTEVLDTGGPSRTPRPGPARNQPAALRPPTTKKGDRP